MKTPPVPSAVQAKLFSLLILLTVTVGWVSADSAQADIYFWKDAEGIIHFSNHNPPSTAEFYMVEHAPAKNTASEPENKTALQKQDPLQARLEDANRKLEKALDKVDALTDKVEQARREARDAAETARRAADEAQTAGETRQESTVVYGVPYRHGNHRPYPAPYYWKHDTDQYLYYHGGRSHKHHQDTRSTSGLSDNLQPSGIHAQGTIRTERRSLGR